MRNVTECGCEQCGDKIFRLALARLGASTPEPSNLCGACGHVTGSVSRARRFQYSPQVRSLLRRLLSDAEFNELRLKPFKSIYLVNAKLSEGGKGQLRINDEKQPIELLLEHR